MRAQRCRTGEIARGLGALVALLLLLAGLPVGLAIVAGSPLPHAVPTWAQVTATLTEPDTDATLWLSMIKVIGWAAWCTFTTATVTETAAYLRGHPARLLPRPLAPMQYLARDLIAMIALIASTGAPTPLPTAISVTHHATAPAADQSRAAATTSASITAPASRQESAPQAVSGVDTSPERPWRTRTIKRGDTLWAIARHSYGSGSTYPRIFNASRYLRQPGGLPRITDPDEIYPGQHITIPQTRARSKQLRGQPPRPYARHRHEANPSPSPARQPDATTSPSLKPLYGVSPPSSDATASPSYAPPTFSPPSSHPSVHSETASPRPLARPSSSPSPQPQERQAADRSDSASTAVSLRTGGYVSLGLAAAISIALAATRLHRRRRRNPPAEWPDPAATPSEPAVAEPVAVLRKAHLDTYTSRGEPIPADADLIAQDITAPAPTQITVGTREGRDVVIELSGLSIGLLGPTAPDVIRAIVTELLVKSNRYRVEIIIPEPDAEPIFAGTGIDVAEFAATVPGLITTPSLEVAITHLEAEVIHRARLMETTDEPTVPALRATDPGEPLPAIIIVATAPDGGDDRLRTILQLGSSYCVGGLLLGHWATGTTLHLDPDATVTHAHGPGADTWNSARLFHLPPADTAAMLHLIQTANGAAEPTPPAEPNEHGTGHDTQRAEADATAPDRQTDAGTEAEPRPVVLHVFGSACVHVGGEPLTTGLRRIARDLLVYLALNPHGSTLDQAIDALMPDRDPKTGTTLIHTAINNVRKTLRNATGLRESMFIIHTVGRYCLDPNLIDVDLWQIQTALDKAHCAITDTDRIQALQTIPDLYTGELADDLTYEWAETERENLRRRATDALTHLAHLKQNNQPEQALAILEKAIAHDPYAEPLYQTIMRLQAHLNRPDALRRTYQLLTNRLADLDTEPTNETRQLHQKLLRSEGKTFS